MRYMLASLRRIGNALLFVSVLSLGLSLLSAVSLKCGAGAQGCLATAFTAYTPAPYVSDFSIAMSTPFSKDINDFATLIQITSSYALVVAVGILIALECVELHYMRQMFKGVRTLRLK